MEFQSNAEYLSAFPPKLEDAGLEDCALPIEGIQEAFRLAAEKVQAAADSVKEVIVTKSIVKDDGICTPNPGTMNGDLKDVSVDTAGSGQGGSCVDTHTGGLLEEGKDSVVDPDTETKEDKLVVGIDVGPKLGGDGCIKGDVEGPPGITGISSGVHGGESSDGEELKGPILTGAYL